MFNFIKKIRSQVGLAVDETILASIMVASLGGFAAVNVPWEGMFGTSQQLVSVIQQVEDANSEFYNRYSIWPHQATNGGWKNNAYALVSPAAMKFPYNNMTTFTNLVPDLEHSSKTAQLMHNFGNGGEIAQRTINYGGKTFMEIILSSVPWEDARKLDEKVDGKYDPENGKVYLVFDSKLDGLVNLHYRANAIN